MDALLATPSYYLAIGGIGVVGLIASIIFGDLLDAIESPLDFADGWLSTHAIATAMAFFGLTGIILHGPLPELAALVASIVISVIVFACTALLMRYIHRQQGNSNMSRNGYYAQQGVVTQRIPAEPTATGEIQVTVPKSGIVTLVAYTSTSQQLPVGTKVVIHRVEQDRVHVIPLNNPETEIFDA